MSTIVFGLWIAAAVLTLIVWSAWRGGVVGHVARIALSLLALSFSAVAVALLVVGQKAHWTSDGPGMLLVMIGIGVSALIAFALWTATIKSWRRSRRDVAAETEAGTATPRRRRWTLLDLGVVVILVVCTVGAARSWLYRPAHDNRIAGTSFVGDGTRVYSLDVTGMLKIWALQPPPAAGSFSDSPYRLESAVHVPEARDARDMWVSADGRQIALLHWADVTVLQFDPASGRATVRYVVPGGTGVARSPGGGFIVSARDSVRWFAADSTEPTAHLHWDKTIVAVAGGPSGTAFADGAGRIFFVVPGSEPRALAQVPFPVQFLSFSGDGKALVVIGLRQDGLAFDVSGGAGRPVAVSFAGFARPFAGAFALVCSPRVDSCVLVDSQSGRSRPAFSGIVHPYDRIDAVSQAALIASGNELFVVSMPPPAYTPASARLVDRRH